MALLDIIAYSIAGIAIGYLLARLEGVVFSKGPSRASGAAPGLGVAPKRGTGAEASVQALRAENEGLRAELEATQLELEATQLEIERQSEYTDMLRGGCLVFLPETFPAITASDRLTRRLALTKAVLCHASDVARAVALSGQGHMLRAFMDKLPTTIEGPSDDLEGRLRSITATQDLFAIIAQLEAWITASEPITAESLREFMRVRIRNASGLDGRGQDAGRMVQTVDDWRAYVSSEGLLVAA